MFPRKKGYQPKFRKGVHSEIYEKSSNFRPIKPSHFSSSANDDPSSKTRRKPHVLAGMFANAKSSIPPTFHNQFQISPGKQAEISKASSALANRDKKLSNFPRISLSQTWDFSDASLKDKEKTVYPPVPERTDSDLEFPEKSAVQTLVTNSPKKHVLPWLRKGNSYEVSVPGKPLKVNKLETPVGFEKVVNQFSSRLDRIQALPALSLQNHTNTTMGKIEKTLMAAAFTQTKEVDSKKSLPLFELLVERSDWLLFKEEYNDETDYPSEDLFYSHDFVSSAFEEYEQAEKSSNHPSYYKNSSSVIKVHENNKDDPGCSLELLDESDDFGSQEDFFNLRLTTSQKGSKLHQSPNCQFPSFAEFSASSTTNNRTERKRKMSINEETPNTSTEREDISMSFFPAPVVSTDYSPFDYSLLSSSSPPSPNGNQPPSKFFSVDVGK